MKNAKKRTYITIIPIVLMLSFVCISLVMIVFRVIVYRGEVTDRQVTLNTDWIYEETNEPADLQNLKEGDGVRNGYTLLKKVNAEDMEYGDLCIESKGIHFQVYINDNYVYQYSPKHVKLFGKSEGMQIQIIPLANSYTDTEVRILYTPIYEHSKMTIRDVRIASGAEYTAKFVNTTITVFALCLLSLILGIILILYGIARWRRFEKYEGLVAIGVFNAINALWVSSDIGFLTYITGEAGACHFIEYIMIMLSGYPMLVYMSSLVGKRKSIWVRIGCFATLFNILFQMTSTLIGWKDYHELLTISHILVGYCIVVAIGFAIYGIRTMYLMRYRRSMVIFSMLIALAALGDMVVYVLGNTVRIELISFRTLLVVFGFGIAVFELKNLLKLSGKGEKADNMEYLAYHDALTSLYNRQAYFKEEKRIADRVKKDKDLSYMFIQFDVNNLKTMNDVYGHEKGDELINSAAIIIQQSFGQESKVFRMGGDEFLAIRPCTMTENISDIEVEFNRLLELFNSTTTLPEPMSIAYGTAIYRPGHSDDCQTIEEAYKKSDKSMYEMKMRMKQQEGFTDV